MDDLFAEFRFTKIPRVDRPTRTLHYDESHVIAFSEHGAVIATQAGQVVEDTKAAMLDMSRCEADLVSFDDETTPYVLQRDVHLHCGRHADVRSLYTAVFGHPPPPQLPTHHLVLHCFVEGRVRSWW